MAVPCTWKEAELVPPPLSFDPYTFHRFPFLTESQEPQVLNRYFQTSTCST